VLDPWTPARTIAEVLRDAGYSTGAYTEDALLAGMFGFWFGFDRFVERALVGEARGTETFLDGARFLRANRDRRFFLFLHTYKVHAPYVSGPAYGELFTDPADWAGALAGYGVPPEQRASVDAYDRAIREADDQVARLLAELERLGLADDTYVVLLSDHGEAFGEHGFVGHGFAGHQEQLRIPLVLRGPGIPAGARVAEPASIADVLPTLLDLLGLGSLDVQGSSLAAALAGPTSAQERSLPFAWIGDQARGLRRGSWKLLESGPGRAVAFDLATDPRELHPVLDPAVLAPQRAALERAAAHDESRRAILSAELERPRTDAASERMMESLRALGYLQ
jgi:arylsulfatase A-like enzyme